MLFRINVYSTTIRQLVTNPADNPNLAVQLFSLSPTAQDDFKKS